MALSRGPARAGGVRARRSAHEHDASCTECAGPGGREGSLEAPTRHPIDWRTPEFYDEAALEQGARARLRHLPRLPPLLQPVQLLPDAVRCGRCHRPTGEVDGVDKKVYWEVVDHCYLCDMCFMTKCPYVPPHPWNVDFPHLMLRAKAVRAQQAGHWPARQVLAATDAVGTLAGIPVVVGAGERREPLAARARAAARRRSACTATRRCRVPRAHRAQAAAATGTTGRPASRDGAAAPPRPRDHAASVALFTTCYGNRNEPELDEDLVAVFEHNGIEVRARGAGALLRHAAAGARRSRSGREAQGSATSRS